MARSSVTEDVPVDLLVDLGYAVASKSAADDRAGEMMRLSSDPLLLRGFLARVENARFTDGFSPPVLLPLVVTGEEFDHSPARSDVGRRETLLIPSVVPERYDATADDWSRDLVAGEAGAARGHGSVLVAVGAVILLIGLMALLLAFQA